MTDCDGGVQKEKGPGGVRVKKCTSPQGVELGIRRENRWRKEKTPTRKHGVWAPGAIL